MKTDRLLLGRFQTKDAARVAFLAGDKRVVAMTDAIPYPYEDHMAATWIQTHPTKQAEGSHFFALRTKTQRDLIGCISIRFDSRHDRADLGYWIGFDHWNQGYATEALTAIIDYGFSNPKVNKIWATHKTLNLASGRVMEKAGMVHEGVQRKHYRQQDGVYLDMSIKSILRSEYDEMQQGTQVKATSHGSQQTV